MQLGCQQDAAEKYVFRPGFVAAQYFAAGTGRARRAVGSGCHGRRCAAVVPFVSALLSGSGENARNPAEIIAKMRYLCYNSLKPAACAAARVPGTRGCAGAHGFENIENTQNRSKCGFVEAAARLRARCMRSAVCGNRTGGAFLKILEAADGTGREEKR